MIACNCCPSPAGCKERDECLNSAVIQRSARNWPFPIWTDGKPAVPTVHAALADWANAVMPNPAPAVACWHAYAERLPSPIVTPRPCIHCGEPEF